MHNLLTYVSILILKCTKIIYLDIPVKVNCLTAFMAYKLCINKIVIVGKIILNILYIYFII